MYWGVGLFGAQLIPLLIFSVAPRIITPMKDLKVSLGLPVVVEIQFVGEPQPEVTWLFGDKPMPEKVLVDVKEGYTTLHFPPTKRGDTGNYNLSLVNDSGQAEGTINLIVQGELLWFKLTWSIPI